MEVKACDQQYAWEFVDPPPQDYYCPLCEKILKKPKLTDCCGSHFCTACIDPIITAQKPCPNPECRKEQFQSMIDKRTMNRILELDVLCPLKGRGCHWKGEMGTRDKHLDPKNENSCEYIDVKCTHGCEEDMEKYELAEHLNRFCPKRPHKCEHCDFEDVFDRIVKDHIPVCPKYPLPCHNNCGNEEIPRSDYEQHLSECPHQDIECEFRYAGCLERIKRKDIAQHQQEGVYVHLSLQTAFATHQLTERDRKIEEMSTTWENKHQHLIGDIEKLFHRCEEESKEREENSKRLKVELAQKDEAIERLSAQLHEKEKVIEDLKQEVKDVEVNVLRSQQDGHDQLSKKHDEFSAEVDKTIQDQAEEIQVRFSKFQKNTEAKIEQFVANEIIEENIKRQAIGLEAKLLESQKDSQKKIEDLSRSVEVAKEIKNTVRKQIKEVSDKSNTRADKLNEILKVLDERVKAVEQSLTVSRSAGKQSSATSINNTKVANSVASPTAKETIDNSVHAATAMPLTTVPQSVYDNMSPDALSLLEKLPIGQIEGVYYNPKAGKVLIDKETTEKEDERIAKFETAYQSIVSRKVKTIEVPIPATVSPDALANLIHQYNQTYDQCVFSVQEEEFPCVKIVSTTNRQFDQARTLLADELISPTLLAVNKCEIIQLSNARTKANIAPPTAKETIGVSVLAATTMPLTTVPQGVYDNMCPNGLALLEKLPIGQIEGVYYNPKAGKVLINKETTEKEDERITKFQTAYQSILSRKVKTIEVPIPATVSPDALANLVHQYNQTYDRCVFSVQEGEFPCVKIISTSSRQHDQARTLLTEELVKMVRPILPAVSKCEVIHLSKTRTLTLKKASIVEEEVDIIVNPANERLAHGGGVAAALDNASQGQLQTFSDPYTKKKGKVPVGKIAITLGGGALKCDKVIHAVGPVTRYGEAECERLLTKVITEALKGAEKYNASSIAFPAISTGIFGVRKELVARCLVDTVMAYHLTKPHPVLSDIRIVIIDEKTYAPFARYFQQKMASLEICSNRHRPLIQPAKLKAPTFTPTSLPPVADKGTQLVVPEPAAPPDMTLSWLTDSPKILSLLEGLSDNWYALGSLLGFSKPVLDRINSIQDDPKVYLDRIVTKWLMNDATSSPTVSALVNTLSGIEGTEQIVQSILEEYGKQNAKQFKHQTSQEEAPDVCAIKYPGPNDMPNTTAETSNVSLADSSGNGPTDSLTTTTASTTPNTGAPTSPFADNKTDQLPSSTSASSMLVNTNVNGLATPTTHPLQPPLSTPPGFTSQVSIPTPSGYNHGQMLGYPTTQGGNAQFPMAGGFTTTASTTGVMATGIQQNPTPHPNQPSPRGVTPQLLAQRSPLSGDGMNPQHGEVGPRPAGVGTFNGGHGTTGKNYSQAVAGFGSRQDIESAVTTQPSSTHQTGQDTSATKNSKGTSQTKEDSAECPICLSGFKDPVKTLCGHSFCRGCINEALQHSPYCPSCKTALRKIVGNQPNGGKMTVKYSKSKLPGYYDCGTIEVHYDIRDGTQSKLHPHPGRKFQGAYRVAYLPNNFEGNEVLQLLKRAFNARLIFTVGTSITSGQNDVVTWNDIHHKTSTHGGPYGYPDPTYLARVKADLAAKGIVTVDSTAV